ncbi:MAG: transcription elongation factor GreA [Candidatus Levybacteria bacterium]|nr:transcription elongation factor GreA [Candidatus Levybacteria bacterium]
MKRIRFTQAGFEKLQRDYAELRSTRPSAVEDLKKAREMGDLSENGYYKSARAKLSSVDARLFQLSLAIKHAEIIKENAAEVVDIGTTVTVEHANKQISYQIVGDLEADPELQKISLLSPLGKALHRKKAGDVVLVVTPAGEMSYKILSLS